MRANQRTLLMIRQEGPITSTTLACYQSLVAAAYTGGTAANGATALGDQIVGLVRDAAAKITNVGLSVAPESYSSWISFSQSSFGNSESPLVAPVDLPFTETVTVPPTTEPGTYSFDVNATDADGAVRATEHVTVDVRRQAASNLAVTVDEASVPAGIASVPLASIPVSRLSFLSGIRRRRDRLASRRLDSRRLDPGRLDPCRLDPGRLDPGRLDPQPARSRPPSSSGTSASVLHPRAPSRRARSRSRGSCSRRSRC